MSFDPKQEAIAKNNRLFAQDCVNFARKLEEEFQEANRLLAYWGDNNLAETLTEAHLETFRFEKAKLVQYMALLQGMVMMAAGMDVPKAKYQQINNQIK
ncbi:MAG: hypothetical protein AAFN18_11995 [Cyanobacteria bacterium J06554_6]